MRRRDVRGRRLGILVAWLVALALLGAIVATHLKVGTDLRSFMPAPTTPDQKLLMDQVGEGPGSRLLLVAIDGGDDATKAALSRGLATALRKDDAFTQVVNGDFDLGMLDTSLLPYRFLLSPTLDTGALDETYLADELQQRLDDLGSPAATLLKGLLPRDPTLETLKLAEHWTPARSPEVREGVWFSSQGEALLLAQTRGAGFDPGAQDDAIGRLRAAFAALPESKGSHLTISGPGYFTVMVNAQTRDQADWIGRISTIGFVVLMLVAYRSIGSLLLGALPVATGALVGIVALTLGFTEVHGITLAFGFTLLGVAQEYPIRLLSHRRAGESAVAAVRGLWPLLLTAIASACIAYLAFYASGVGGLKQLAVFTIAGLLAAGFSTRYVLPYVLPETARDVAGMPWLAAFRNWLDALPRPRWLPLPIVAAVLAMLFFAPGPFWQNDLSALTPLPRDLLMKDAQLRGELGAPDVRYLLIVQAPDADGVLKASAALEPRLREQVAKKHLDGFELASIYLPDLATQRARQAKLPDRAALDAMLDTALEGMPFRKDLFAPFVDDVETARTAPPLTPEVFSRSPLGQRLAAMLAQRDDHWVGLSTLSGVRDASAVAAAVAGSGVDARLLDLKEASESLVAEYRTRILHAVLAATALLFVTITLALRSIRRAWHVLAPMTLATFLVLAVERALGIPISLFHLVALILAAGLGLHYALFFERDTGDPAEQRRTLHATVVCVIAALLVFGMLAWSSIPVLRAIGLTVALGVGFHFCLSILMAPHADQDRLR
ncbi:Predicted exporter [Luteibacter sp. UNCMF331Sha3.1]|uniref:MMPL family transporter n=1 Tax=Luteibacter sp. UNCMF331Sha3.1 TaxID=1502760 RepID=UPI0008B58149|nr:MMPL family transporter [Luteibacter sp. UNCMF331Sha3.1]SEN52345.1 Predicted exporter [Luteibacter sp. UNCMF331Sha3.1]